MSIASQQEGIGMYYFCFQAEDGIRYWSVTGVQTCVFFFSSRRRHTRLVSDWSSDVCSSDLSKSNEHIGFPGSFWLSAETLSAVVHDIADSAKASGFLRLVLWNCHGRNRAILEVLARDVRARTGLMVFSLFPPATVPDPIAVTKAEAAFGIHAGDWETSVMLALSPERVRADRLESAFPAFSAKHLSLEFTAATVAWLTRDFQPTGTWGDATAASAERGRLRVEKVVDELTRLLTEIAHFRFPA